MTVSATPTTEVSSYEDKTRVPGEAGIWVLVLGDLTIFALLFCTFVFYRGEQLAVFHDSALSLNRPLGALNTLFLLTSSWFVVLAVHSLRERLQRRAVALLGAAIACGVGFALVKFLEYGEKLRDGITPATNDFYMFYFVLTGIHFLHVLIGLGVLTWMWSRLRFPASDGPRISSVECGAVFWHMVDLLWVVLFALLYLLP